MPSSNPPGRFARLRALSIALLLLLPLAMGQAARADEPRNVLLIIADDLGVDVASFYPPGLRAATDPPAPPAPNLEALADRGVIFANAWSGPTCSPTRASIFTGRYGYRTGIGAPVPFDLDVDRPVLRFDEFSLPEAFRAARAPHRLANLGKWHLSRGDRDPNLHGWPLYKGPKPDLARLEDYSLWPKTVNGVTKTRRTYATTDTVNDALHQIRMAEGRNRPYFLWVAFSAPHSPYHKPPNRLHSRDTLPVTGDRSHRRPYYEAMIEAMDTEIGRLLAAVDLSTTTVIFLGDNGTPSEVLASPLNGRSPHHGKNSLYEGGVRVPLVVAGAGVTRPSRTINRLVHTVDLYPTILELAGVEDWQEEAPDGREVDGVSFVPYLEGRMSPRRTWLFNEKFLDDPWDEWEVAVRSWRYKLIERQNGDREFYDLKDDPDERSDLLAAGGLDDAQRRGLNFLQNKLDEVKAER